MVNHDNKPVFITQWNTHKENDTVEELKRLSTHPGNPIFLITEPSVDNNQKINWNIVGYSTYYVKGVKKGVQKELTRSCILCPTNIPCTFLKSLSDHDQTVLLLETDPKIGIISCYMDINIKPKDMIHNKLSSAVTYFKNKNID